MAKDLNAFWDREIAQTVVPKYADVNYHVSKTAKNGKVYINIREFFRPRDSDEWLPGKAGITVPVADGIAATLLTAMHIALDADFETAEKASA